MSGFSLIFLTRPGCQLCDEVRPLVLKTAERSRADVSEVDVDSDPDLLARYGERVPVLMARNGDLVAEGREFDGRRIRKELRRF